MFIGVLIEYGKFNRALIEQSKLMIVLIARDKFIIEYK